MNDVVVDIRSHLLWQTEFRQFELTILRYRYTEVSFKQHIDK